MSRPPAVGARVDALPTRVVVTGVGLVTPLGPDRESSWQRLRHGATAPRWLDADEHCRFGAARPTDHLHTSGTHSQATGAERFVGAPAAELCPMVSERGDLAEASGWPQSPASGESGAEPIVTLALRAAAEAAVHARLDAGAYDPHRVGCVIGTSKGGLRTFEQARRGQAAGRPWDAELWTQFLPNAPAAAVARRFGWRGPALCPVAACATGLTSLLRGVDLIRDGHCDAVLAGSTDASLQPALLASFRRLGVLTRVDDDPATACRPFDRTRSGFVVGEGAAVLVLERFETAVARGAVPLAEWLAGGTAADAVGLTQLDPAAAGLTWLIGDVLRRSGLAAHDLDYINLHGTATEANDLCETRAVKGALGRAARTVACSGLKGALGHLLGAAGSVETAFSVLALRDQVVPPTANLCRPDPRCDLDYTPRTARPRQIGSVLKLSLGFGGHLAAAVLRQV